MNIAIVKESLCIGGTERDASNMSQVLAAAHNVTLILFDESNIAYPCGGRLIGLSAPPKRGYIGKIINSFVRSSRLKKIIGRESVDAVFVLTGAGGYLMHERLPMCKKIIACKDFGSLRKYTKRYAHALKTSDAMFFNSEYQRAFYLKRFPKDAEKCFVSYNIIDFEGILKQSGEPVETEFAEFISGHTPNIAAAGRFCSEKGFEHLIRAFKLARDKLPALGLILIGDGALRSAYEKLINEFGMGADIYMTGFQQNPYKYMAEADMFVLSSVTEGFPNVIPEAMVCGLPVISTNCFTGPAEILCRNYDYTLAQAEFTLCDYGILTPRFSSDEVQNKNAESEIANAVLYLAENADERAKYSRLSPVRAADFSSSAALKDYEEILSFVCGGKREKRK